MEQQAAQLASPCQVWRLPGSVSMQKGFSQEQARCHLLKMWWKSFPRGRFPVACRKSCRQGWGSVCCLRGSRGFPAARWDICTDTTQQPGLPGFGHPRAVDGATTQEGLPSPGYWETATGRGDLHQLVGSKEQLSSLSGVLAKLAQIFLGIKGYISAAEAVQKHIWSPCFKSEVAGAARRGSWCFMSGGREMESLFFCSALAPKMGKLYLLKLLVEQYEGNQLITDVHCVKFNFKLLSNCKQDLLAFIVGTTTLYSSNNNC